MTDTFQDALRGLLDRHEDALIAFEQARHAAEVRDGHDRAHKARAAIESHVADLEARLAQAEARVRVLEEEVVKRRAASDDIGWFCSFCRERWPSGHETHTDACLAAEIRGREERGK